MTEGVRRIGGNMRKRITAALAAALLMLLIAGCASSGGHISDQVHIAIQPSAAFIPLFIAKEKGWIEEALEPMGVSVSWESFESGPPMNDSLMSGDSDIGVIGDVPVVTAAAPGNGISLVAIAAQAADSYAILVPSDSPIRMIIFRRSVKYTKKL